MGMEKLGSRAIQGMFYALLDQDTGLPWVNALAMRTNSDQSSEEYKWLGQVPALREWVGGRHSKKLRDQGFIIPNKHFEASIQIPISDLRRDKTGQIRVRLGELVDRANGHWASLLSKLMLNGASTVCYDGEYYYDIDHVEGSSGTQSNNISADISGYACAAHGTTTIPSVEEMQQSILAGVTQILTFKDDQGEPMNENAGSFIVQVPASLYMVASKAVSVPAGTAITEQSLPPSMSIDVVVNARLSSWTASFAVFRADGRVKPFICQQETGIEWKEKAEGSDFAYDNDVHEYGIDTWRNANYGMWQHSVLVTMI